MRRQTFSSGVLAAMIGATLAMHSHGAEPVANPPANSGSAKPQASAPSPLDSYRQHIERLLPTGWSIQAERNELIVRRRAKVLVGRNVANPHIPPDPPAICVDHGIYLPGKGDPKKTIYIDEGFPTENSPVGAMRPMPYHLFEPAPGRPVPETRNDVYYNHEPYVMTIRFLPLLSKEDYRRLVEADKAMKAKVERMYEELESRRLSGKFDDFLPKTPDDKRLIAEYKQLKESIQPLPQFYNDRYTVDIKDSLDPQSLYFYSSPFFANGQIGKEVKATRSQIEKCFSRY
jgi:hypothetical protein